MLNRAKQKFERAPEGSQPAEVKKPEIKGSGTSIITGALSQAAPAASESKALPASSASSQDRQDQPAAPSPQISAPISDSPAAPASAASPGDAKSGDSKELPSATVAVAKESNDFLSDELLAEINRKLADAKSEAELYKLLEKSKEDRWIFNVGAYRFDELETKQFAAPPYNIKIQDGSLIVTNPQNFILETAQNQNEKITRLVYINPETQDRINICSFSEDPTISSGINFQNHLSYRFKNEKKQDRPFLKFTDDQLTKILDRGTSCAQEGNDRVFIIKLIEKQIAHLKTQGEGRKKLIEFKQALDNFYQSPYDSKATPGSSEQLSALFNAPSIRTDLPKLKDLLAKQSASFQEEAKADPNAVAECTFQLKLLEKRYPHLIDVNSKLPTEKRKAIRDSILRLGLEGNIGIVQSREEYNRNTQNGYCDWPLSRFLNGHIKSLEDGQYPTQNLNADKLNQQAGGLDVFSEGKQYPSFNMFLDDQFVPIACAPGVSLAQHNEDAKKRVVPYKMPMGVTGCGDLSKTKSEGSTREESKGELKTVHQRLAEGIRRNNPIGTIKWIPKTHRILAISKEHSEYSELVVFAMNIGESSHSDQRVDWVKQSMVNCGSSVYHTSNCKSSRDFHDRFKGIQPKCGKHSITLETCNPNKKQSYCNLYVNCSFSKPILDGLSSLDIFGTPPVKGDEDIFKTESKIPFGSGNKNLKSETETLAQNAFTNTDKTKTVAENAGFTKLVSNETHEKYAETKDNWGNLVGISHYEKDLDEHFWGTFNDPLRFKVSPGGSECENEAAIREAFRTNILPWIQSSEFKDQLKKASILGKKCQSLDMSEEKLKLLILNYIDACKALYKNPDSHGTKSMYKILHDKLCTYMPVFEDLTKLDMDGLFAAMEQVSPECLKYNKAKMNLSEAKWNSNLIDGLGGYQVGIEELFVQAGITVSPAVDGFFGSQSQPLASPSAAPAAASASPAGTAQPPAPASGGHSAPSTQRSHDDDDSRPPRVGDKRRYVRRSAATGSRR